MGSLETRNELLREGLAINRETKDFAFFRNTTGRGACCEADSGTPFRGGPTRIEEDVLGATDDDSAALSSCAAAVSSAARVTGLVEASRGAGKLSSVGRMDVVDDDVVATAADMLFTQFQKGDSIKGEKWREVLNSVQSNCERMRQSMYV